MPKSIPAWCPAPGCQVRHHDRELHRALCAPVNTGDREERQEGGQDSHITGNVDGGMGKAVLAVSITVSWPPEVLLGASSLGFTQLGFNLFAHCYFRLCFREVKLGNIKLPCKVRSLPVYCLSVMPVAKETKLS